MRDRRAIGQREGGRHRFLCGMAGNLKDKAILDLGCGFGWFEKHATNMNCARILGVDTDGVSLERAKQEAPSAEFARKDVTLAVDELSELQERFDIVTMFDFYEHLPLDKAGVLLTAIPGLLEPGGNSRLLISVPYRGLVATALDPAFYFGHRHYRSRDMETKLDEAGFAVENVVYAGGLWEQLSMIWLYVFKWLFAREMPFASFLEMQRAKEYEDSRQEPGRVKACATMFLEARPYARNPVRQAT